VAESIFKYSLVIADGSVVSRLFVIELLLELRNSLIAVFIPTGM